MIESIINPASNYPESGGNSLMSSSRAFVSESGREYIEAIPSTAFQTLPEIKPSNNFRKTHVGKFCDEFCNKVCGTPK